MKKTCNVYGKFFQGILIGSFLGAMTGMLLAPRSGKELRSDVKEKSKEAQALFGDAKERATEWTEGAKHRLGRIKKAFSRERVPEYTESMEESEGMA